MVRFATSPAKQGILDANGIVLHMCRVRVDLGEAGLARVKMRPEAPFDVVHTAPIADTPMQRYASRHE